MTMLAAVIAFFIMYRWWKREQELHRRLWLVKWSRLKFDAVNSPSSRPENQSRKISECMTTRFTNSTYLHTSQSQHSGLSSAAHWKWTPGTFYSKTAELDGVTVAVRMIRKKVHEDRKLLEKMLLLTKVKHRNLTAFYGLCLDGDSPSVLWEYCCRGSIQDVFHRCRTTDYKLDTMFQFSFAVDICAGLAYLHNSKLKVHGNLRSSNCLVDQQWMCKLSGFGQDCLEEAELPQPGSDEQREYARLFWTAPECLRSLLKGDKPKATKAADIYSVGVILKEVLCRNDAFEEEMNTKNMTPQDIVNKVASPPGETLFRPCFTDFPDGLVSGLLPSYVRLVQACWQEDPSHRPTARRVLHHLKRHVPFRGSNVLDSMVQMAKDYSSQLKKLLAEGMSQEGDPARSNDVSPCTMLLRSVAEDRKRVQQIQAESFESATIYVSDIVDFTQIARQSTPEQILQFLDRLQTVFDDIIKVHDVYKLETTTDTCMLISGLPERNEKRHVTIMANVSLAVLQAVNDFVIPHMPHTLLRIRIGLHTGPVVAGVVGSVMPRYYVFGDTVRVAATMESCGTPLKIHISQNTYEAIREHTEYLVTERGEIHIKGKGKVRTFYLEGKAEALTADKDSHWTQATSGMIYSSPAVSIVSESLETKKRKTYEQKRKDPSRLE